MRGSRNISNLLQDYVSKSNADWHLGISLLPGPGPLPKPCLHQVQGCLPEALCLTGFQYYPEADDVPFQLLPHQQNGGQEADGWE